MFDPYERKLKPLKHLDPIESEILGGVKNADGRTDRHSHLHMLVQFVQGTQTLKTVYISVQRNGSRRS